MSAAWAISLHEAQIESTFQQCKPWCMFGASTLHSSMLCCTLCCGLLQFWSKHADNTVAGWAAGLQQRHGGQVPGGAAPGAAPGMANGMPANLFRMRRGPGMQVRMVRIDLKALVQMAVVALVLYQVCSLIQPVHAPVIC